MRDPIRTTTTTTTTNPPTLGMSDRFPKQQQVFPSGESDEMTKKRKYTNDESSSLLEKQPTINISTIGHVSHGKTSLLRALTGGKISKDSREAALNCTIKLGYTNVKVFRCKGDCKEPSCFTTSGSSTKPKECGNCGGPTFLVKHVSFIDSPGHNSLVDVMLGGAGAVDSSLLVVAANQPCPQPQTREHVSIAQQLGVLKDSFVVQSKIDLVTPDQARANHKEIKTLLHGTDGRHSPVIPISASKGFNVDVVANFLANLKDPVRDLESPARLRVLRSFDINKPGADLTHLKGGVVGGCLLRGILSVGDKVEVRPGLIIRKEEGRKWIPSCTPLLTQIKSLTSDRNDLKRALPGGTIALCTLLDPALTRADRMVGQVVGPPGSLPPVFISFILRCSPYGPLSASSLRSGSKVALTFMGVVVSGVVSSKPSPPLSSSPSSFTLSVSLNSPVCLDLDDRVKIAVSVRLAKLGGKSIVAFAEALDGKAVVK